MMRSERTLCPKTVVGLAVPLVMLVIFACSGLSARPAWADDDWNEIPFAVASLFFELNNTDGDLGIHALIDGEPWKKLEIEDPRERRMLLVYVQGRLRRQGLTELFFESAEPSFEELDPADFFKRFPEGVYEISGVTLDGQELESTAVLSHVMPAPVDGITVSGTPLDLDAIDCDEDETIPVVSTPIVISWEAVTESHPEIGTPGQLINVDKYQVVVAQEDLPAVLSVDLPPDQASLTVPAEFSALAEAFKLEILVRAANGNQTAIETCFKIAEP